MSSDLSREKISRFREKVNQSIRIRGQIVQRKLALWNSFDPKNVDDFIKNLLVQSKKEEKIVAIFEKGTDDALNDIDILKKADLPDEYSKILKNLRKAFKQFEKIIRSYKKRIKKELELETNVTSSKLWVVKDLLSSELMKEKKMLKKLSYQNEDLQAEIKKIKAPKNLAKVAAGVMAPLAFLDYGGVESIHIAYLLCLSGIILVVYMGFADSEYYELNELFESDRFRKFVEEGLY